MDAISSDNVQMYTTNGTPQNNGFITSITDTAGLTSVSPNTGSAGGTLLTVTGTGFGPNTASVGLLHFAAGSAIGTDICATTEITGYGTFTCMTIQVEVLPTDVLAIDIDGLEGACVNTLTPDNCSLDQQIAASPAITVATLTDENTVTFTGTDFSSMNGWTPVVTYLGVDSSSGSIDSDTQVTVTFDNGVPASSAMNVVSLGFFDSVNNKKTNAYAVAELSIQQVFAITGSTSVTCSFQGGCQIEVMAPGLTAALASGVEGNRIEVCERECVFDADVSSSAATVCNVPSVPTSFSASQYNLATSGSLESSITWSSSGGSAETAKVHDNDNLNDYTDGSSSCWIQMDFKPNYAGVLEQSKFFINNLLDNTPFVDNLIFQGSDDGSTWTDLWTIDANIHEGWNDFNWEDGSEPAYNKFRFAGSASGACRVGEIKLSGIEAIQSTATSYVCDTNVFIEDFATVASPVTYDQASTPLLTSIEPRFGSVLGNEPITFVGTGFGTSGAIVTLDGKDCAVTVQIDTEIVCTTSSRADTTDAPTIKINIAGTGDVATNGLMFRYVKRWSDPETWGMDAPPLLGEAVHIPSGMHLLVDVDETPILSFVTVEGSLIFAPDSDPNHERKFHANYVMVRNGYFEAGTHEFPYTSKLTITMYSNVDSPYLPIYGNKVIGVRFGQIELHGIERPITWTDMKTTADIGATEITLNDQNGVPLDWQVGEKIVIAPTGYNSREAEQRTIMAITAIDSNPVITLDTPLEFKHFAGREEYDNGADFIEMRAEVGLLTRNVVYQGDPSDSAIDQYGAHIMIHSPGDESCIGRIENVEFFNVGQAFKLGRYPIHFHMIGTVHQSYIRNNAIW